MLPPYFDYLLQSIGSAKDSNVYEVCWQVKKSCYVKKFLPIFLTLQEFNDCARFYLEAQVQIWSNASNVWR